jgi:hypothetical protein
MFDDSVKLFGRPCGPDGASISVSSTDRSMASSKAGKDPAASRELEKAAQWAKDLTDAKAGFNRQKLIYRLSDFAILAPGGG